MSTAVNLYYSHSKEETEALLKVIKMGWNVCPQCTLEWCDSFDVLSKREDYCDTHIFLLSEDEKQHIAEHTKYPMLKRVGQHFEYIIIEIC